MELLLRRLAVVVAVVALTAATAAEGYNITKILGDHPEYSQFNKLLTETRLAGDINRRRTITVLVVANGDMGALSGGHYTLPTLRHILEMHILVDYYGAKKLHQLARGDTASSSMFQESGSAPGTTGYVNITQHRGGRVSFTAEDAADSATPSSFVKSVKEIPYDLAVLQISKPLSSPEAEAPVAPPGAGEPHRAPVQEDNGLTLFCPVDAAVDAFLPKYKNLTAKGKAAILLYHAVPDYYSLQLLKSNSGKVSTLATASVAKKDYSYDVSNDRDSVLLDTKVNSASVTATVKDADPLAVYAISKFLQPKELFKVTEDLAPAPAPEGPKKKTKKKKPSTTSAAAAPSDDSSAADSPDGTPADDVADKAAAAPSVLARWVTAAATVAAALALAA
ncbi:hypothetical protein OsJ_26868 [Oryza sativa Japonica Group]|uniref:FAS1 domain-containing protein n=1 Tax=Oryza sativa subsp. japonica TaxID=39947 RepID=A3BRV6_ORYSJ|nr:hypothetical protein OsJ_26868 [Oryza sativa Japonica Group]